MCTPTDWLSVCSRLNFAVDRGAVFVVFLQKIAFYNYCIKVKLDKCEYRELQERIDTSLVPETD